MEIKGTFGYYEPADDGTLYRRELEYVLILDDSDYYSPVGLLVYECTYDDESNSYYRDAFAFDITPHEGD